MLLIGNTSTNYRPHDSAEIVFNFIKEYLDRGQKIATTFYAKSITETPPPSGYLEDDNDAYNTPKKLVISSVFKRVKNIFWGEKYVCVSTRKLIHIEKNGKKVSELGGFEELKFHGYKYLKFHGYKYPWQKKRLIRPIQALIVLPFIWAFCLVSCALALAATAVLIPYHSLLDTIEECKNTYDLRNKYASPLIFVKHIVDKVLNSYASILVFSVMPILVILPSIILPPVHLVGDVCTLLFDALSGVLVKGPKAAFKRASDMTKDTRWGAPTSQADQIQKPLLDPVNHQAPDAESETSSRLNSKTIVRRRSSFQSTNTYC